MRLSKMIKKFELRKVNRVLTSGLRGYAGMAWPKSILSAGRTEKTKKEQARSTNCGERWAVVVRQGQIRLQAGSPRMTSF
jgi:hypothetical protein